MNPYKFGTANNFLEKNKTEIHALLLKLCKHECANIIDFCKRRSLVSRQNRLEWQCIQEAFI